MSSIKRSCSENFEKRFRIFCVVCKFAFVIPALIVIITILSMRIFFSIFVCCFCLKILYKYIQLRIEYLI